MITDALVPKLLKRFPDRDVRLGSPPDPIATFPPAHPDVGEVTIWDDGDEVMIAIGEHTHGHFNPYDDSLSSNELEQRVTDDVLDFLEDLFADRIIVWSSPDGRSGGWRHRNHDADVSLLESTDRTFTWSGPITNPFGS